MEPSWESIVDEKRARQLAAIPPAWRLPEPVRASSQSLLEIIRSCGILTSEELQWTEVMDISELVSLVASRKVSSVQLTTAFCKRAAIAQQLSKCLTEIFFDQALVQAQNLDEHLEKTGTVVGPLHGVPVSVKDRFDIKGLDTTFGWVGLVDSPARKSSSIVQLLESMGAVLYVKTNVPQSLMTSDSFNYVFGQSVNAFNPNLISGGSSGGEGALLGLRGSVLGIGSDIGGSIRIPSNLQGLYSICPTTGRVPWDSSFMHQFYMVPPVAGPMANSLPTIEYFMKSLLDCSPWNIDPGCVPIPWREDLAAIPARKLRIGVVFDDGAVKPQPPITRLLRETVHKLKEAGHEDAVVEWDPSVHIQGANLWTKGILADGGQHSSHMRDLVDEPLIEGMCIGTPNDELTTTERELFEQQKWNYQTTFLNQWQNANIDALLLPVTPWVGLKPKTWVHSTQWLGYTAIFNLLNYAVVTVPVGKADAQLDRPVAGDEWTRHVPRNGPDSFSRKQYDIDLVKDMPVSLQVVGGRFGEEQAVSVAKVLDKLMN